MEKSLNKLILKAISKSHQTMQDLSSTVWDTLLGKESSPEAEAMRKQTRSYAEVVRPFVLAFLGMMKSSQE